MTEHAWSLETLRLQVLRQVCGRCHEESLVATEETCRLSADRVVPVVVFRDALEAV